MSKQKADGSLAELRSSQRWTEEDARQVMAAWKRSGETVAAFARREGLCTQRVYWWRDRLGLNHDEVAIAQSATASLVPAFLPVTVRAPVREGRSTAVTVVVGDGLRVEVTELGATSAAWVVALVRALGEVPS
jgi:transposase-like protein